MAKILEPQKLFTHPEWVKDKQKRFREAELKRQDAERLTNDADRFEDETNRRTQKTLNDVNKKLEQRIKDINYWNSENEKKSDELFKETDMLNTSSTRIDKARSAIKEYLHLSEACKTNRTERYGIDQCADDVHFNINKELETYKNILNLLDKNEIEACEQLRRNRKANYRLYQDSLNKKAALAVDEYCLDAKPHSSDIFQNHSNRNGINPLMELSDWMELTNDNIHNGEKERMNSETMRAIIDGILQQISNDMIRAVNETNISFKKRICELKDTKAKDEEHMNRVWQEIKNTENSMEDLRKCLNDKINFLTLAIHRLSSRNERPGNENCLDDPHIRLNEEICEINLDIDNLRKRIIDHEFQLNGLRRQQLSIEEDIQCKSNSIFIDEVICMGIRETIIIKSF